MQTLGVKKFLTDYLVSGGILFLVLLFSYKSAVIWHEQATVVVSQACSAPLSSEKVLLGLKAFLKNNESCEVVSPCIDFHSVRCEVNVRTSDLTNGSLDGDTLVTRMRKSPVSTLGISSHDVVVEDRLPVELVILLFVYGVILIEVGAVSFALWRQNRLKQILALPGRLKSESLYKPAAGAVLFAVLVVLLNYLVFHQFDHPEVEELGTISLLLNSASGIFFIIVMAPLAEEMLFRGVLLRFFIEKHKLTLGIVLVSVLFSLLHGFKEPSLGWQLYVSSIYFVLSVILCRLYIKQKNLWSPIIFHGVYNSIMVILYRFMV